MLPRRQAVAVALMATAMTAVGGAAYASGGVSGGGGTGSGGGGSAGGGSATSIASCATIGSLSSTTGYFESWAAIWTPFSITNKCATPVNWQMTYVNNTTGVLEFEEDGSTSTAASGTVDEDWAAFSTTYTVTMTVTDATGAVLATRTSLATTKAPRVAST